MTVPKNLTVHIDTRENRPLVFPKTFFWKHGPRVHVIRIQTERIKMDFGDYTLAGYDWLVCGERKGSLSELFSNHCTVDSWRFRKAWAKLLENTKNPFLVLDVAASEFESATEHVKFPHEVLDMTMRLAIQSRVPMLWLPPAKSNGSAARSGEAVLRWMWNTVWMHLSTEQEQSSGNVSVVGDRNL